jgi:hypothetical protein
MDLAMEVIEAFTKGRHGEEPRNEDGWAVTPFFAAVVDGETCGDASFSDPSVSAGRFARDCLLKALQTLPSSVTRLGAVGHLNRALLRQYKQASRLEDLERSPELRPSASAVIYSRRRRELWIIGRGHARCNDQYHQTPELGTDFIRSMRGLILKNLLAKGASREALRDEATLYEKDDFKHMLKVHATWRNNAAAGRYQYLGLDGFFLPATLVAVVSVPRNSEVTLATDGYPWPAPTLDAAEERLQSLLRKDPLCIGELRALQAWRSGQDSHDDRTYLRFRTD